MFAVGVDVQLSRDCPFVVLDEDGRAVETGWFASRRDPGSELAALVVRLRQVGEGPVTVGIDAPRCPLDRPRQHAFRAGTWKPMNPPGKGRHCEVAIRSLNLANPQWTPLRVDAPDWMQLGFDLFTAAAGADRLLEVFPTAAYRALNRAGTSASVSISFESFAPGPKDMLDALTGAFTALQVARGEGSEVGGGDGLGTIALPRPLTPEEAASPVLRYPA